MHWLIALEDEDERKAVSEALFRLGIDYQGAATYESAIAELKRGRFDVVLARKTRRELALLAFVREVLALVDDVRVGVVGSRPVDDPRVVRLAEGTAEAVVEEALVRFGASPPKALRYKVVREITFRRTWSSKLAHDGTGRSGYFAQMNDKLEDSAVRAKLQEWVLAAREVRGECVAPMSDTGLGEDLPFAFYDAPDVLSLDEIAERGKLPLPLPEALAVATRLAAALKCMHDAGVTHGAVLCATCGMERTGRFWLCGAGLAGFGELLRPHLRDGRYPMPFSEHESAPEVIANGATPSPASDVYQFGAMTYELVTGAHPLKRDDAFATYKAMIEGDVGDPRAIDETIPAPIAELLLACLALDPKDRPANGAVLAERLAAALPRPSFFARLFGSQSYDPDELCKRTADRAASGMSRR